MLRVIAALGFLLTLTACGSLIAGRDVALHKGGQYYDEVLETAVLWKCRASSVGSVERRYMRTTETWALWTGECLGLNAPELPEGDESMVEELPKLAPETGG